MLRTSERIVTWLIVVVLIAGSAAMATAQEGGGRLVIASYASDPEPRARMEELVRRFEEATGVDVELNTVEENAFNQSLRTYLASDEPPDVLTWYAGNRSRFFIDRGLIMPVSDVWEAEGWTETIPEGFHKLSQGSDGEFYFIPTNYYWWGIYYRPSLFEQAGITAPPETFDELLATCDALREVGVAPITIGTLHGWPGAGWFDYLNMRTNGPEFHVRLTDGKVPYNSPEIKATFANWRQLLDHDCFIEDPAAMSWQDAVTPMLQGEAAMYLMGAQMYGVYPEDQQEDLDFFRFPIIDPSIPVGEDAPTDGYFIPAASRNPDAAKAFAAFVGSQEMQAWYAVESGRLAVREDVPVDAYSEAAQRQGAELVQGADYVAQFYDRDTTPEMAEKGMDAFVQFMTNPDDVDAILDALEAERQRIFADE